MKKLIQLEKNEVIKRQISIQLDKAYKLLTKNKQRILK
jgi:hypothetical protein